MRGHGAIALVIALAAAGLASCGGDEGSDGVFDREDYPFTFTYPDTLVETDDVSVEQQLGGAAQETVAIAIDEDNAILVQRFRLRLPVDESNLDLAKRELEGLLARVDANVALDETEIAGFPALTAEDITVPGIPDGLSDLTAVFDGADEYVLNCQSSEEHRAEIDQACEEMIASLAPRS